MKKLKPVLDGEYYLIGKNPDLGELQGKGGVLGVTSKLDPQQCVDHHVFQSADGGWHLWGCVRNTAVGRILYHWRAGELTDVQWECTGELIRADVNAGESRKCTGGVIPNEEFMRSPYVVYENGTYYMFYSSSHIDADGNSHSTICLMLSHTGADWHRYRNADGYSAVFMGPAGARDPMLTKKDGLWRMYYAAFVGQGEDVTPGFFMRTSNDLLHWSDAKLVYLNRNPQFGNTRVDTECPHVVKRGDYYYLFRTQDYGRMLTHVFISENPDDFGIGDSMENYVCTIGVAAPEIIVDGNGQEYITSNHDLAKGTHMCRLKWVDC